MTSLSLGETDWAGKRLAGIWLQRVPGNSGDHCEISDISPRKSTLLTSLLSLSADKQYERDSRDLPRPPLFPREWRTGHYVRIQPFNVVTTYSSNSLNKSPQRYQVSISRPWGMWPDLKKGSLLAVLGRAQPCPKIHPFRVGKEQ